MRIVKGIMLIVTVVMLAITTGCRRGAGEGRERPDTLALDDPMLEYLKTQDCLDRADSIVEEMTLAERASQVLLPAMYADGGEENITVAREYARMGIGGIVLLKGDSAGVHRLVEVMDPNSRIAPIVAIDAEWGLGMRLIDAPKFPVMSEISENVSEETMFRYGSELGRECKLLGVNMVLGPVLDVSEGRGVMKRRALRGDAERVARLTLAYGLGIESQGVMAVAKHFPGHGSVATDSHREKGMIKRSLHSMDSIDLVPFRLWAENSLSGVMVGHLAVPSIDSKMMPAAVSPVVIGDLLRRDLGFNGLVLTDALNMGGAEGASAVDALQAGAELIIAPKETTASRDEIIRAVQSGDLDIRILNRAVKKIIFFKLIFGVGGEWDSIRVKGSLESEETQRIRGELTKNENARTSK